MRSSAAILAWVAMILGGGAASAPAPVAAQDVTVQGQLRPRTELRDLGGDNESITLTSMRVRAGFLASLERAVSVFVQLQDVRIWGEESNTLTDFRADNLDLHQGYLKLGFGQDGNLTATVGRQETILGGQRLVGAVGFSPQGRSFDGVRMTSARNWGSIDFLAYKLREGDLANTPDAELLGAYTVLDIDSGNQLDLYVLYNTVSGPAVTDQATFGARMHGAIDGFVYRGELTLQRGQRADDDVAAYLFGARVGRPFDEGRGTITLWYDYLSGDTDPGDGKSRVFDTLFATNHKFYGLADLFLDIPAHTDGLGLQDAAVKGTYAISDVAGLAADLHHFRLAHRGPYASASLGQELDLTFTYRYTGNLGVTVGHSLIFASDALADLGRATGTAHFGYIMLDALF